jgi:hypothetical protein
LLSFLAIIGTIKADENIQIVLVKMIFVQQVDFAYDSVNFDDPISTQSYFKMLYISFTGNPEEVINNLMTEMMKKKNKDGSRKHEVEAQHIMRSAAEKIHGVIRELKQDTTVIASEFVALVMRQAVHRLVDLVYDSVASDEDDDDFIPMSAFHIRDNTREDAGVSTDYEPLE